MKETLAAVVVLGVFTLGCGQSDPAPPMLEATPTPTEKITDMDFESGEVEQPAEKTDQEQDAASEDGE
jgi:hypothetical protein